MSVNPLTLSFASAVALIALAAPVCAQSADVSLQSLPAAARAAETALRRELDADLPGIELAAAQLDPRLRLAACAVPLESSALPPRGAQARVLVRVSCRNPTWNLNVPVDIRRKSDVL